MKHDYCVVCGSTDDLQQHHIEPVVFSGVKRKGKKKYDVKKSLGECDAYECFARIYDLGFISDDGEITVCSFHHNIIHGIVKFQKAEASKLVREGLENAKRKGIVLGRKTNLTPEVEEQIIQLKSEGVGYNTLAKRLSVSVKTIRKVLSQNA